MASRSDGFAVPGTIYLLHFEVALQRAGTVGVQHYLGWCLEGEEERRLCEHTKGQGARITAAAGRLGQLLLARSWAGDRYLERRMKRRGRFRDLCPICQEGLALP